MAKILGLEVSDEQVTRLATLERTPDAVRNTAPTITRMKDGRYHVIIYGGLNREMSTLLWLGVTGTEYKRRDAALRCRARCAAIYAQHLAEV